MNSKEAKRLIQETFQSGFGESRIRQQCIPFINFNAGVCYESAKEYLRLLNL